MKIHNIIIAGIALCAAMSTMSSCTYSNALQRQESGLAALNRSLSAVQDQASADAAASAVRLYGNQLASDLNVLFQNGKPSLLELLMLKNSYQSSNISTEAKNVLGQLIRIGSNGFYNSTDLRNATVQAVLNQITGSKTATSARVPQPIFLQPATSTGVPATTATPGLLQGVHQLLNGQR